MSKLIDYKKIFIETSKSSLTFGYDGVNDKKTGRLLTGERYLTLDGKNVCILGTQCDTCSFFFEQIEPAKVDIANSISLELKEGLNGLNNKNINELYALFPKGKYIILLSNVYPRLKKKGEKSNKFDQEYYNSGTRSVSPCVELKEYIIPLVESGSLEVDVVNMYKSSTMAGIKPTAISVSVVDSKSNSLDPNELPMSGCKYLSLGHYLIDGHHKIFAASELRKPITLLSFLSIDNSMADEKEIDIICANLK